MSIAMTSLRVCKAEEMGFRFPNRYNYALSLRPPFIGDVTLGPVVYGLCGGMCYAALDYYHAGLPVPRRTTVPRPGDALYRYLWKRQMNSLQLPMGPLRILRRMFKEDEAVARSTIRKEFPKLRYNIARLQPSVLLMIYARSWEPPTRNHQVVAVGYDLDEVAQRATIFLYDPNYPGKEPTLHLDLRSSPGTFMQSTGETPRGFFLQDYRSKRKRPPGSPRP
ncbi:MAG: hypothetical protein ACLFV5_11375 [Anaerolineales bacterium]